MDHGNIPQLYSGTYRVERLKAVETSRWPIRLLQRLSLACYWLSLRLLARIATRTAHYLLVSGEDIELAYRQHLGVSPDRIIRYPYLIDTQRYAPRDTLAREQQRARLGLSAESILVAMVNRLAPEKGLDIALQGISGALEQLPADLSARVRVVIAGDGPLRAQIEEDIRRYHLESTCLLLGTVAPDEVAHLLGASDLFLFTAIRDSNSVAVLEAMAAGLPVIASTVPPSKAALLAGGRGLAIPPGDADAVALALAEALRDPTRCKQMGNLARAYIEAYYSAEVVRQSLLRATGWPLTANAITQPLGEGDLMAAPQGMA
jgi:glycosyltransferase involved in cell wall biosynthesis